MIHVFTVQDTQADYNTLAGTGRHIDVLKDTPDPPCASPLQGQYGKLNMEVMLLIIVIAII